MGKPNTASPLTHHRALAVPTIATESLQRCRERGRTSTQIPWVQPAQAPLVPPGLGQQPLFPERLTHTVCLEGTPAPCDLMIILQTSYTSCWEAVGLTPETPIPILFSTTELKAHGSCRRRQTRVLKPPSWGWPTRRGASSKQGQGLCSGCGTERVMVDVKGTPTFSALLQPTISRVQSCPPAAPCSSLQSLGVSEFLKNAEAAPAPHSARAEAASVTRNISKTQN